MYGLWLHIEASLDDPREGEWFKIVRHLIAQNGRLHMQPYTCMKP